jgi:arsenate reductase
MAEGLVNELLGDQWEAVSAGTKPSGYVHPLAVKAMAELGIDISEQWSKSTDNFKGQDFDLVVTVCDNAAQNCPTWLGDGHKVHIGFPDPAAAEGDEPQKLQTFREVRDGIRERVVGFVATWEPGEGEQGLSFELTEVSDD